MLIPLFFLPFPPIHHLVLSFSSQVDFSWSLTFCIIPFCWWFDYPDDVFPCWSQVLYRPRTAWKQTDAFHQNESSQSKTFDTQWSLTMFNTFRLQVRQLSSRTYHLCWHVDFNECFSHIPKIWASAPTFHQGNSNTGSGCNTHSANLEPRQIESGVSWLCFGAIKTSYVTFIFSLIAVHLKKKQF